MTTEYTPPRVTFVGSDPKIPALTAIMRRLATAQRNWIRRESGSPWLSQGAHYYVNRYRDIGQARNRRIRVLMETREARQCRRVAS
jgi:hypothetical protein